MPRTKNPFPIYNPKSKISNPKFKMPWFVKIEQGIVEKPVFDQYVPAHRAYVRDLISKGHRAKTGYWARRGGGMLMFEAGSMDEVISAEEIAESEAAWQDYQAGRDRGISSQDIKLKLFGEKN